MNDPERFTKQMDRTREILRDAIQRLDVPLARKDNLSVLLRDLRQITCQAGRTEMQA
jgi:hypothetical protein